MKTQWQIQMDYKKAMDAVTKLRSIAYNMDSNLDNLRNTISAIDNSWEGENSEAFIAKSRKVQDNIAVTADGMRKVAATIEEIARVTRDAELAAIRIVEQ